MSEVHEVNKASNAAQAFYGNAIFWVEVDKIKPNPFQPRKEFDETNLKNLAGSIRQYGVLQPLVVTRKEVEKEDGGLAAEYELIAGERRLRASKLAGLIQVPVLIRTGDESDRAKLELAIIENLQREDLNAVDRAKAFDRLVREFGFKHTEIAARIGKSREYVGNTIRILLIPQEMQDAVAEGKITEGHTRPLLMLTDRPAEQQVLFREIMQKRLTVRDTEAIARRIAFDRVRRKQYMYAPEILEMEKELGEKLGTRVMIEPKDNGGKLTIDYFAEDDLRVIFGLLRSGVATLNAEIETPSGEAGVVPQPPLSPEEQKVLADDRTTEEKERDENTFDPSNFSI